MTYRKIYSEIIKYLGVISYKSIVIYCNVRFTKRTLRDTWFIRDEETNTSYPHETRLLTAYIFSVWVCTQNIYSIAWIHTWKRNCCWTLWRRWMKLRRNHRVCKLNNSMDRHQIVIENIKQRRIYKLSRREA